MRVLVFSLFNFLFSLFLSPSCTSLHFLSQNQSLKDGQTLVSDNRNFELGFFSPGTTKKRYVGIWYTNIQFQTVVWVANRENPLTDSSGILSVVGDGNLVILDGSGNTLWSSSISTTSKNSTAMLLDSNLILTEGASANSRERTLWQSFDHPTDTLMPKMMIGVYLETGKKRSLTSWKSKDDPAPGKFSLGLERQKVPQAFLYNESRRIWRSGQWNGQSFVGIPKMHSVYLNGFILETDRDERIMYLTHDFSSIIVRFLVDWSGMVKGLMLREDSKDWSLIWRQSISQCDVYGMCGSFGSCNHSKSPICACLIGFQPESAEEWGNGNWSVGCVRRTQLQCEKPGNYSSMMDGEGDGFLKMERVKLPDFADWLSLGDAKGCEAECLQNCSCVAYAYVSGIGCMIWVDGLIDIQEFSSGGEVLYIRLANSELENASLRKKKRLKPPLVVLVVAISILLGSSFPLAAFICYRRRQKLRLQAQRETSQEVLLFELGRNIAAANKFRDANNLRRNGTDDSDLKLFSFATISAATDNFSAANELGQGGFGPVYKGKLLGGQEIAVKRLSRSSGQGLEEFKNEIILIAKLQHMNLVRLFGCSIEGDEKILIYEYMPNKSLDSFLFDPIKKALLHWGKRVHIIEGIAQGLLYLHKYSRLKVIHRDLKTSNILLDGEMNPKISDFGMARIFRCNESEGNTNKVVGTYGYMSPEYAVKGLFSIKSDVFSFGVILLEILSGRKNNSFYHSDRYLNLLGYAWELWEGGRVLELVDPMLGDSSPTFELLRCIHVALLCVQEHAADRPTMSDVVSMLGNETIALPTPKQPAFSFGRNDIDANLRTSRQGTCSSNDVTVSEVEGR